jgi:hypothetical protein
MSLSERLYLTLEFCQVQTPPWAHTRNKMLTVAARLNGGVQFKDLYAWTEDDLDDVYQALIKDDPD